MRQIAWHDPTAGLAGGEIDVAFVWLPLPDPASFAWEPLAGNAKLYQHDGVVSRPVVALGPATLAVARRADDSRELVADFVTACRIAVKGRAAGT